MKKWLSNTCLSLKKRLTPSPNPNQKAKHQQFKIVGITAVFMILAYLAYHFIWSDQPIKKTHAPSSPQFAGVFDSDIGQNYDHAKVETLMDNYDQATQRLNTLDKKLTKSLRHPTPPSVPVAIDQQLQQLKQEQMHLKQTLAQLAKQPASASAPASTAKHPPSAPPEGATIASEQQTINAGIEDQVITYADHQHTVRNANNYVWAGSFANGYLLTGIVGDAGTESTKNTGTVAIKLTTDGTMPNGTTSHLKDCVVLGSTYGDLSSDSDVIHLETLSCAGKQYSFEKKVYGSVFDLDAMQDLRGLPVLKAKPILGYAAAAGLIAGIGDGLSASSTQTTTTGAGIVSTPTSILKSGLGAGISKPADKITDYLMAIANMYHPIVVAHAGRKVTVLFQAGFWIDKKHRAFQSMSSINQGESRVTKTIVQQTNAAQTLAKQVALASGETLKQPTNQRRTAPGDPVFSDVSKGDVP
jgi:conjugal transfer pilus assembly protein TraB